MKAKRFLVFSLSIALVFSLLTSLFSTVAFADMPFNVTCYTETFDDAELPGWESTNNTNLGYSKACVTGGKFVHSATDTNQIWAQLRDTKFDFATYKDYTVICKLTLGEAGVAPTTPATAGISVRNTTAASGGYEFQLCCPTGSTTGYVRLFERGTNRIITSDGNIVTNKNDLFELGQELEVKVAVEGNNIKCFLGDTLVIDYTDEKGAYPTGSAGIRFASKSYLAVCDDFTVNHTEILPNKFYDDFSSYNQETNALKASALRKNGWSVYNNATAGFFADGALNIPSDCTYNHLGYQSVGAKGALAWNDYSVEADVTFGEGTVSENVYAGVAGRHNDAVGLNPNGYEVQIFIKTDGTAGMRIYSRGASGELAACDAEIEQGKAYNVKAVFQGNRIDAYIDGVKMLTATDNDYQIGFAGIRYIGSTTGTGITTTIDNFVVYDYDIIPAPTPNKVENFDEYTPSYLEDGVTYDKQYIQKAGWGSSSNAMLTNYVPYFAEGRLTIPTTADNDVNLFLNTTKAKEWQNYSVSWDIRSDANSSGTYIFLGGRITDYKTGYFLKIYMGSSGHIREIHLQDKYKGNDIGTALVGTKTGYYCPETSLRPLCSTAFTVKMEFNGTSIKVYLNDTLIIEATDETYTKGSIAMNAGINSLANNSAIEVDNITVFDFDNLDQYVKEIVGDCNGDEILDANDTTVIIGRLLQDSGDADINKDGVTDIRDAVRIKRILESF